MNESEKDRILRMVSEGVIRPAEAAHLLAALADEPASAAPDEKSESKGKDKDKKKEKDKPKDPLMEVQMQRPDGSHYTVKVPPNLFPMFWQMAKVALKESARSAAQDTWAGLKTMVRAKTEEVKTNVKTRVNGVGKSASVEAVVPAAPDAKAEARRAILQMIQNGRISADDASRLIQQLDALETYESQQAAQAGK